MSSPLRIVVVHDSAMMRESLAQHLDAQSGLEVVGRASEWAFAFQRRARLRPDVIVVGASLLDTSALAQIAELSAQERIATLMITEGAEAGQEMLRGELVDSMVCPPLTDGAVSPHFAQLLRERIRVVVAKRSMAQPRAETRPSSSRSIRPSTESRSQLLASMAPSTASQALGGPEGMRRPLGGRLIAIGASTGGTIVIEKILRGLSAAGPPILITQHIPRRFSDAFARRLDGVCAKRVMEAQDGMPIERDCVYVAPGDCHLKIQRSGIRHCCLLDYGAPVGRHRPAVDVMFSSVARGLGIEAIGVLLTGMGDDGAKGMKELYDAGSLTIIQDEASSTVWGMPQAAFRLGVAREVLNIESIIKRLAAL